MPRALYPILFIQFLSTFVDNAFLLMVMARVLELDRAAWIIPLLKLTSTVFYVFLAPIIGVLSDVYAKGGIILVANILRLTGVVALMTGMEPILAMGINALGSALHAPAKYGLLTELAGENQLVRVNGIFESASVCAVLSGTVFGGWLIGTWFNNFNLTFGPSMNPMGSPLFWGLLLLLLLNSIVIVLCLGLSMKNSAQVINMPEASQWISQFIKENRLLLNDKLGGLSLMATTLLWRVGATLQLIVLRWGTEQLGLSLEYSAYLQASIAVGIVLGAILASRYVQLEVAHKLIPLGVVLGLLVPLLVFITQIFWAVIFLIFVGALSGFFIVPMNALLQHRGVTLLSSGRSVAVQGFFENLGMLIILALYAFATAQNLPLFILIFCFGFFVCISMLLILMRKNK